MAVRCHFGCIGLRLGVGHHKYAAYRPSVIDCDVACGSFNFQGASAYQATPSEISMSIDCWWMLGGCIVEDFNLKLARPPTPMMAAIGNLTKARTATSTPSDSSAIPDPHLSLCPMFESRAESSVLTLTVLIGQLRYNRGQIDRI